MPKFIVIWAYLVRQEHLVEFESAYQSDGEWALFFRRDEHYLGTEFCYDRDNSRRFVTIDSWTSQADYEAFKLEWRIEYQKLDAKFEYWTEEEELIGQFSSD